MARAGRSLASPLRLTIKPFRTRDLERKPRIDVLAQNPAGSQILISMKWQQVGGTAEQKIPFEVICLVETLRQERFQSAYLVLGGDGWRYKDVYLSGALNEFIRGAERVNIVTLDRFVSLANQGKL